MSNAENFINRLRTISRDTLGKSREGVCLATISIFLDWNGEPLLWYVEGTKRFEPAPSAREVLRRIFSGEIGIDNGGNDVL